MAEGHFGAMMKKLVSFLRQDRASGGADLLTRDDLKIVEQSGLFDHSFYRERYPGLAHLTQSMALAHFVIYGAKEGKSPSAKFDTVFYLESNPDVASLGMNPLVHFIRHGQREGRQPTRNYSIDNFPKHVRKDAEEIFNSGLFSYSYYLDSYPDVASHVDLDPLQHFCTHGWKEGRNPNPVFSTSFYLDKHPDVAESGMNPFVHWIRHGRGEGRKIALKTIIPRTLPERVATPSLIFISHDSSRTGAPAVLISLMRWLRQNTDLNFSILVGVHGAMDKDFESLAPTFYFQDHSNINLIADLKEFCGSNVQYIYCNTIVSSVYAENLWFLNAEFIAHIHELEGLFKVFEAQFQALSKYCKKFIAVSDAVRDCIERRVSPESADIIVIPPFIDEYDETRKINWSSAKQKKTIIFGCGTVEKRKGFDLFCVVGKRLRENGRKDVKMYWIGSDTNGDLNGALEIRRNGVEGVVEWLGPQSYPRGFFRHGDIFLLPSREDPFPLVCLEAADCGLPIICFDEQSGGMHRFVSDDAGLVVPHLNVEAMTKAVINLLDNEGRRKKLGQGAQYKVRKLHYVDRVAPRIASLFENVLKSNATTEIEAFFEQIDRSEIVSFDIFDTLVTRRISEPNVVFDLLEFAHTQDEPAPLSLFRERMDAAGAELQSHNGQRDDVAIDQIYERMAVFRNARTEKEMEIAICIPHSLGRQIFEYARQKGKTIYIASDMYLDEETIVRILSNCGYSGWHQLFLSSALGLKKDTGRLYEKMVAEAKKLGVVPQSITHFGDNWLGDVRKARSSDIRAIRFDPLNEESSEVVPLAANDRQNLSQTGRIWDAICTQAFRVWINEHSAFKSDVFIRLGFQVTGPFAAMFAMHVRKVADRRNVRKIFFMARDGRIVKDAFDALYSEEIGSGLYDSNYIHLSRATVIPATLRETLSSNDLYFLMEGLHLGQKPVSYFLRKAGLDSTNPKVREVLKRYNYSYQDKPTWDDRTKISEMFLELSHQIERINVEARQVLLRYLESNGFLQDENILIVDVGWLLNIQSRLAQVIRDTGGKTRLLGAYVGSRDRINKNIEHDSLLFEMGEPALVARQIEQHTTLFEVLFSAPEPSAAGLTKETRPKVIFKGVDTESKEFQVAQGLQFGAREFFKSFSTSMRKFAPEVISRDYLMCLFSTLLASRNDEVIAAFSDFEVALGGSHDLKTTHALIEGDEKFDYQLGRRSEQFSLMTFTPVSHPRGKVVIVTSAGLNNGSTRYRAVNLAESLAKVGIRACVVHCEEKVAVFESSLDGASAVIFQRCFDEQGNVGRFLEIARRLKIRCLYEMDDLVFPDFVGVIGSVAGGEWDVKEALHISSGYERFLKKTDGCIVSTPRIGNYVGEKYHLPTTVFPNRISARYLVEPAISLESRVRIGYAAGTRSHKKDFEIIESVVFELLSERADVTLYIVGAAEVSSRIRALPNVFSLPVLPYDEMIKAFAELDLMLVPLEDSPFNSAKSNIKFIECGALGVPVIASPADEYLSVIQSGENGWIARSKNDWKKILLKLIENPALVKRVGLAAFDAVRDGFNTDSLTGIEGVLSLIEHRLVQVVDG